MRAIVLTCSRYEAFTRHMIMTYDARWPDHPLRFRIPYQDFPVLLHEQWGDRLELVPSPEPLRETVENLLADVPDDEWVYWCIDDKYLIDLVEHRANAVVDWVSGLNDPAVVGVSFARARDLLNPEVASRNLDAGNRLVGPAGLLFIRRKTYAQIWLHQFLRVKVIRELFSRFPDGDFSAKEMDGFKKELCPPAEWQLYVAAENLVVFGESTSRGKITQNCVESFERFGLAVPEDFEPSERSIVIGSLDSDVVASGDGVR
jgi:hypothetical protein